ncbi:MAG: MATE family efflux transporter [Candidatus Omnitrophica bacterium]|nr:MATE family efflux transporter [Candidatus Omnitrophota bacterium]MCM8802700.1 MATE family efflux transporter [Candidatus Omnitrophota bacterium]
MIFEFYGKKLLKVSVPLILSSSIWTIQHFVDRMFVSWYSVKALAAVLPASFLNLTTTSIFIGTAYFVNTFVAQYYGAKKYEKIGEIVWQGLYWALIGGIFHLFLIPFAPEIFKIFGHEKEVLHYETIYFQIVCTGAFAAIGSASVSSFFSGQGKTKIVLFVSFLQTSLNLILDYILIFGKFGFPQMGIKGAGIATVISGYISLLIYLILFFDRNNRIFGTLNFKLNVEIFKRLLKYGVPNGIQFFLDIFVWTIFLLVIGRQGVIPLSSSNIAFNINTIAFMPMLGIGTGVSILVGQYIGREEPEIGEKITYIGFWITFIYMCSIALSYVVFPEFYIKFFKPKVYTADFNKVKDLTIILLKFVAFYSIFDTMNVIFLSGLRGAGDTKFIMFVFVLSSIFIFLVPLYICTFIFNHGIFVSWTIATLYVILIGFIFFIRFHKGNWKKMKIIERSVFI